MKKELLELLNMGSVGSDYIILPRTDTDAYYGYMYAPVDWANFER